MRRLATLAALLMVASIAACSGDDGPERVTDSFPVADLDVLVLVDDGDPLEQLTDDIVSANEIDRYAVTENIDDLLEAAQLEPPDDVAAAVLISLTDDDGSIGFLADVVGDAETFDVRPKFGRWKVVDSEVFMEPDASDEQIDAVGRALKNDDAVEAYEFLSKDDAFEEFKRIFADEPELIANTTADVLPTSFRVELDADTTNAYIEREYDSLSGVHNVVFPGSIKLAGADGSLS